MQCPSCGFQNLPGLGRCARCLSVLVFDDIDVQPYRAGTARSWRRQAGARMARVGALARHAWSLRRVYGRLRERVTDGFGYRGGAVTNWQRLIWLVASVIPGLGLMLAGRRRRGRWILLAYLAALAASVIFMAWAWTLFFGIMLAIHAYSIVACLSVGAAYFHPRTAVLAGLAAVLFLQVCVYTPAASLMAGAVRIEQLNGVLRAGRFKTGDAVLVQGRWFAPDRYERGDIVSYILPVLRGQGWYTQAGMSIDRILAVPGDHVVVKNRVLRVNGSRLPENKGLLGETPLPTECDLVVPEGMYFIYPTLPRLTVHGVNVSAAEFDMLMRVSMVPAIDIRGRAIMIVSPPLRLGRL